MTEDWRNGGFGIYIHWPFCASKCPYCDFNSHVQRDIDQGQWREAYLAEIDRYARMVPDRVVQTVFFGGGTPSLMPAGTVAAILDRIALHWPMANDPEITLEANPGSVEAGRFADFASAGVSRVSVGVQALNEDDLKRLGRLHTVSEALAAIDVARRNFERVSFDLIYARQHQSVADWEAELQRALALGGRHLSLYQLTIEAGTAFGDRYALGQLRGLPDDDRAADMYDLTQEICTAAGLPAYEVSNHAAPGEESRHNLIYWRYGDYIGIGPGAHGRISREGQKQATEAHSAPAHWLAGAGSDAAEAPAIVLDPCDQASEYLLMGLRIVEGIDMARFEKLAGQPVSEPVLADLESLGLIIRDRGFLRVTSRGRPVLDSVIRALLPERGRDQMLSMPTSRSS